MKPWQFTMERSSIFSSWGSHPLYIKRLGHVKKANCHTFFDQRLLLSDQLEFSSISWMFFSVETIDCDFFDKLQCTFHRETCNGWHMHCCTSGSQKKLGDRRDIPRCMAPGYSEQSCISKGVCESTKIQGGERIQIWCLPGA